jgi:hypothetical protein
MAWPRAAAGFGAGGLLAGAALFVNGCVAVLDDDFEIIAAEEANAHRSFGDAGDADPGVLMGTGSEDAGAMSCVCRSDARCCPGVGCAQCCSDSDCPKQKICQNNRCLEN